MSADKEEIRYGFGKNWAKFIEEKLSDKIIEDSRFHMASLMRTDSLAGKVFLDIGCGSGIHSLAAHRMGAERIISFDYDVDSVRTTERVREYAGSPANWEVFQGSVLDKATMEGLPKADVVYSWGVLHHTGSMWEAVTNSTTPMKPDGVYYIALYSSDNYVDPTPEYWIWLKQRYNRANPLHKRLMEWQYAWRFHIGPELRAGRNPLNVMRQYGDRGMTYWTDVKDWLGGYPMEFASLAQTQAFVAKLTGMALVNVKTGEGCTEYVFADPAKEAHWGAIEATRQQLPMPGPYNAMGGQGYSASLPALVDASDNGEHPRRSRLMIFEDGRMLGIAHSIHEAIRKHGGGRFSHWGPDVYFSALDGSDPNQNRRVYTYCEEF